MTAPPLPAGPPPPCLGDELSALVDGELDHAARERVQSHLAHCVGCRAEVDGQRQLKVVLGTSWAPPPGDALTVRLLQMRVPGVEPTARATAPPVGPVRPAGLRRTRRPPARSSGAAPGARRGHRRTRRRAVVGSTLVVLGLGAALALGGPRTQQPSVSTDPGADVFVADYTGSAPGPARPVPVQADLVGPRR